MDTLDFLQTILPDEGNYYLVLFSAKLKDKQGNPIKIHKPFSDLETMAEAAARFDNNPEYTAVYHACAAYLTPYIELEELNEWGKPKRKYRVAENQYKAKAFWVDIDCGQVKFDRGEGYIDKRTATAALFKFCDTLEIPRPMLVDSGNGVHAYWPLTKAIKVEVWTKVANALKACLAHAGVIADPTRTADFASILRPPGTTNRKGGETKDVAVKRLCTPIEPELLATALSNYVKTNDVKMVRERPKRQYTAPNDLNSDLTGHLNSYPEVESSGALVADKCSQVALMRDTKGDVSYEHWRGVIGVLKHCVDGEQLSEEWSSERLNTGHDQDDWRTRYDTWEAGPTSCEFFSKCNPLGCEGCDFKGKVKGPIMLGRVIPINEEKTETVLNAEGEECEVDVPAIAYGYQWGNGLLARLLPDKDGIMQAHPFSTILFYPTSRIRTEDGTYRIGMRMHLPNKKVRDFEMSAESMASQTDMLRALARYELMQSNHKDAGAHMAAYLRDQLETLKRKVEEVNTLTTFGWKNDDTSFLIGDRLYLKDGTARKVLVSGGAAKYLTAFNRPARADVKQYAEALNSLYNHPGREHWQYAVVAGWGSILAPFCEELYKGLVLALQGGDSGKGKTTVSYASMYAFGNAIDMTMNSKDGFTYNALWAVMATFNNIPILLDELTNMDGQIFSDMAYGVAAGQERVRLQSKGGTVGFATTLRWRLSPFVTGNRDFHGLLAATQANSQAEAVRLVQIDIDRYPKTYLVEPDVDREELSKEEKAELDAAEAAIVQNAIEVLKANRGVAGEMLVQYVLANAGAVADEVRGIVNDFVKVLPDNKYRFYRCHAACSLTMARIARDLGIIDFDLASLRDFTEDLMVRLADTVTVTNTVTAEDAFSRMMASLAHRILVTQEFRDKRHKSGPETPRNRITSEIAGRYVLGSANSKDCAGQIMLSQKEVRDWCMKNRTDFNKMLDQLESDGALVKRSEKLTLTRGTDLPTVQARCIIVDSFKLDKDALTLVSSTPTTVAGSKAVGDV
jgi:uncharacterized protein YicC (UPF0701 family)